MEGLKAKRCKKYEEKNKDLASGPAQDTLSLKVSTRAKRENRHLR